MDLTLAAREFGYLRSNLQFEMGGAIRWYNPAERPDSCNTQCIFKNSGATMYWIVTMRYGQIYELQQRRDSCVIEGRIYTRQQQTTTRACSHAVGLQKTALVRSYNMEQCYHLQLQYCCRRLTLDDPVMRQVTR